ncbi:MAG: tol-pal system YbgF family protein [Phycisphaerae bacterium]
MIYALLLSFSLAAPVADLPVTDTVPLTPKRLSDRFTAWLDANSPSRAVDREFERRPRGTDESVWIEHALMAMSPEFCAALDQFDRGDYGAAIAGFLPLQQHVNPFLAGYSQYYLARTRVAAGLLEEAESQLQEALLNDDKIAQYSPHEGAARVLLAHAQFANLRYDDAAQSLAQVEDGRSEFLRMTAQQLTLELERREKGTLAEVAAFMDYSADRLGIQDAGARVQARQDQIVAMLDKMIQDKEQQEQQQQQSSSARPQNRQSGKMQPNATPNPSDGRVPPRGKGEIGDLHTAPKADPGEAWGNMPPAEREKVLERLKERYPARYRQLVEQYYRSMAEER